MIPKGILILVLLLVALALGCGCSMPRRSGGSLVTPASAGGPQAPASSGDFSPGPVVTVPPEYGVEIQVNKNMIFVNPDIDVFYRGGKGQIFLQKMVVQVLKSDGTYETGQLVRDAGGQIAVGDKVRIQGTTGTDRVVVTVTILNKDYKIYDQNLEFKTRP
jgi:hypothetical protein